MQASSYALATVLNKLTGSSHPQAPTDFNAAWLFLLGKSPLRDYPIYGSVYTPTAMRPLSIVNSYNRLLASALRYRLAPLASSYIGSHQRGFLPSRSILANILDMVKVLSFALSEGKVRISGHRVLGRDSIEKKFFLSLLLKNSLE